MKRLGLLILATACASGRGNAPPKSYDEDPGPPPAIVQVREFPHSATVEVLAWSPDESAYGVRAVLRRDGTLVRDHRFYVSTYYGGGFGFGWGTWYGSPRLLPELDSVPRLARPVGVARDDEACFYDLHNCSPFVAYSVRIPDEVLRGSRDGIAVLLYRRTGKEMVLTLHRDVIDPYLRTVDSVAAALRQTR
jgi:hypothetical protein